MTYRNDVYDHRRRERRTIGDDAIGGLVLTAVLVLIGVGTVLYVYLRE